MWIRTGVARDDEGRIVKMSVGNLLRAIRIDKSKTFTRSERGIEEGENHTKIGEEQGRKETDAGT